MSYLIALHLRFHGYGDHLGAEGEWTDSAVRRYVRDAGDQLERLHILTRADCTTRNQAKAAGLRAAYDDLERRITELGAQEELNAMRPDLDGNQIMTTLGIPSGRDVGRAYQFLLEMMIAYGVQYRQHMELRLATLARAAAARTAAERQQREEAQRTVAARTDLLAVVAHELRTPIAARA